MRLFAHLHFRRFILSLVACLSAASFASAAEYRFDFSSTPVGESPKEFKSAVTGEGGPAEWKILLADFPSGMATIPNSTERNQRPVLAQTSKEAIDGRFPVLIYTGDTFNDFTFRTRFKTVSGTIERMAGLAFRMQDESNYYVVRYSALGHNLGFYAIKDGHIYSRPITVDVQLDPDAWHELSVSCKGNAIVCKLDGKQPIPDMTDPTFTRGRVGFWTKSDAVSYYADASLTYTPRESFAQNLVRDMKKRYPHVLGLKISAYLGGEHQTFQVVASVDEAEIGHPADAIEKEVIARGQIYYGKGDDVTVAIPLHDKNGDIIASVRVLMKSFKGQTEANAVGRAVPIVQAMEAQLLGGRDLLE